MVLTCCIEMFEFIQPEVWVMKDVMYKVIEFFV